jgi:hypothetical protein
MLKLKRGKKTRRKMAGIQKREEKGSEKGRKKGYCDNPNDPVPTCALNNSFDFRWVIL